MENTAATVTTTEDASSSLQGTQDLKLSVLPTEDHPSSKSSTADEASSIEALNWSDLEDDDLSTPDSALLQSIHSQLSDGSGSGNSGETAIKILTPSSSQQAAIEESSYDVLGDGENENIDDKDPSTTVEQPKKQIQGMKRKRAESPMTCSTLSVVSSEGNEDLSSNAAVLDDGPIWAKGSKKYKFEENRRINQKLTFGVLLSVVLAIGLGLGNLVAYNECEAEHKAIEVPCPMTAKSEATPSTLPSAAPFSAEKVMQATPPLPRPAASEGIPTQAQIPLVIPSTPPIIPSSLPSSEAPELSKVSKPMIDPKYVHHAEELSRVLKLLDELSRKIDKFENTTRQLGGIVMMHDELPRRDPPTKKTKFLNILSEFMQTKRLKKKEKGDNVVKTWKDKKEEVLDEIAGAVLQAMGEEDLEHDTEQRKEILLEDSQVFSVDEDLLDAESVPPTTEDLTSEFIHIPEVQKSTPVIPSPEVILDSTKTLGILKEVTIPSQKSNKQRNKKQFKEHKEESDKKHIKDGNGKKLKRQVVFDIDDDVVETIRKKKQHKHRRPDEENRSELKKSKKQKKDKSKEVKQKTEKEVKLDWEVVRANERDTNRRVRYNEEERKASNKRTTNWQLERDIVREQFRKQRPSEERSDYHQQHLYQNH